MTAPRRTKEQWAEAALDALARGGLAAVAVEPIARELGVTKGSFYWHFRSREQLIEVALARWEEQGTEGVIAAGSRHADARGRLRRLFEAALERPREGFLVVHLTAAAADPLVGPVLERVTKARVAHVAALYQACGLAPADATHRAVLAYAAYLGLYQALVAVPSWRNDDRGSWVQHAIRTLVPPEHGVRSDER
jgi:AcrR family transcriptional regulator